MNYIKHLTGFFEKVERDKQLNPTHISLYIALFQGWNCNRFKNPISISRDEIMRISKISSKATYHKCLKALHTQGYINYEPSYNPYRGSHVYLFNFADDLKPATKTEKKAPPNFEPVSEQAVNKSQSGNETGVEQVAEQVVVPYINNTNITNNQNIPNSLNLHEPEKKIENSGRNLENQNGEEKEKDSAEKEKDNLVTSSVSSRAQSRFEIKRRTAGDSQVELNPSIEEVLLFFQTENFPELEANKFYNYFNSIGWLVGGKTKMVDWHSAAKNWMLNAPKYQPEERHDRSTNLNTSIDKDYGEPL